MSKTMDQILKHNYFKRHDKMRTITEVLIQTYKEWSHDGTLRIGAGIAYYGIIAIVPIAIVAVGIAEIFYSSNEISTLLESFVGKVFGEQATAILPKINNTTVTNVDEEIYKLGLIGIGSIFISASLIFIALQDALNVIWKAYSGFKFSIKRYAMSFIIMLVCGATMTAILLAHSMLNYASHLLPDNLEIFSLFTGLIGVLTVFLIVSGTILLLLKSFITVKISTQDLLLSSGIIAGLMYVGMYGLAVYFGNFADKSIYGALAGVILVLVAIYYFAQIFLAGAQLSKVIAYRNGNEHLQKHLKKTDPR